MPTLALVSVLFVGGLVVATLVWLVGTRRRLARDVKLFADFMDNGPFVAFMKDADGRYIYENRTLVELTGRITPGVTSVIGKTDHELFPAAGADHYVANDRAVIASGRPMQFAESSVDADGTVRHWSSLKFPRADALGRPCIAGVTIDISDLTQARTAVRSSEDRCSLALEAGHMGSMSLNLDTLILDTSPVFAVLHGNPESVTHIALAEAMELIHHDDRPVLMEALQNVMREPGPQRCRYRVIKPDGTMAWIELVGNVCHDETGRPAVVRAVGFDVTERQHDFDELSRRRDMLRRLIDVQENERQTLCHELHDGPIQYAIAAKMHLESARNEDDAAARTEQIDAAVDCLTRGIAEGRQVIRGVRPAVLDDLGLTAAIEDLVDQVATAGITVTTALGDGLDALPSPLQTTIYRIVQESLTNARKYSGADRATVEIRRAGAEVRLRVKDEGCGFDMHTSRPQGFGLAGMTERVRIADGIFRVESRPGAGTEISASLPIRAADDQADAAGESAGYAAAAPGFLAR
ncbi:MAG: PAS domain-containing protein [Planctomycetaceae bacterium]